MSRKERLIVSKLKEVELRKVADRKWTFTDLLNIFGLAIRTKLFQQTNPHNRIGKNYFNSHDQKSRRHPAGTKLVRGFIRHSGRESAVWRSMYAEMTGKNYGPANASP